jgi:hypothetical protein
VHTPSILALSPASQVSPFKVTSRKRMGFERYFRVSK